MNVLRKYMIPSFFNTQIPDSTNIKAHLQHWKGKSMGGYLLHINLTSWVSKWHISCIWSPAWECLPFSALMHHVLARTAPLPGVSSHPGMDRRSIMGRKKALPGDARQFMGYRVSLVKLRRLTAKAICSLEPIPVFSRRVILDWPQQTCH